MLALFFILGYLPFPTVISKAYAAEDAKGCDVQPNNAKVYSNSKLYPFIRSNDGGHKLSEMPPEGYVWEIEAIKIADEFAGKNFYGEPIQRIHLGTIKTYYIRFIQDGETKVKFDQERMFLNRNNNFETIGKNQVVPKLDKDDAVTVGDFPRRNGDKYDIVAFGQDGRYICPDKGDDWEVDRGKRLELDIIQPEEVRPGDLEPVDTGFGTIPTRPAEFASTFLRIAIGVAGGVSFLLMVFGSYRLVFAGGNPESIQSGRQIITAAIVGLLVVIFSVFLLNLIGKSILKLPL